MVGFAFNVLILNIDSVLGEKFREEPALGVRVSDLAQCLFINHSSLKVAAFCRSLRSSSLWSGFTRLIFSLNVEPAWPFLLNSFIGSSSVFYHIV